MVVQGEEEEEENADVDVAVSTVWFRYMRHSIT